MKEETTVQKQEKPVVDTFEVFEPQSVLDEETGEVLMYKVKRVVSRKEIEVQRDEAQKVVDRYQKQLDLIDSI